MNKLHLVHETQTKKIDLPRRLSGLLKNINAKRKAELIRFHTCCADPRASK